MADIETIVIGAGVVGLAIARSLALSGQDVLVVEQHGQIGSETSSRNSEVIHAGIYYPKDSLKARHCVEGKMRLYAYCESHHVPFKRLGKLIVAANDVQELSLSEIADRARNNGVFDLEYLGANKLKEKEPELDGRAALFSPSTGIIDSHAFMLALQGDAENAGAQIAFHTEVSQVSQLPNRTYRIEAGRENAFGVTCKNLIICAGLHVSELIERSSISFQRPVPRTRFAKGNYFRLSGKAPFSHLIYPVPEPGGLGVHLTLDLGGQARFGPDVEWIDKIDYDVDYARGERFYNAIRTYWPGLPDDALAADYAGVRPKLSGPEGPASDFVILDPDDHGHKGLVVLMGIESPGLTASLSLAETVRTRLENSGV